MKLLLFLLPFSLFAQQWSGEITSCENSLFEISVNQDRNFTALLTFDDPEFIGSWFIEAEDFVGICDSDVECIFDLETSKTYSIEILELGCSGKDSTYTLELI